MLGAVVADTIPSEITGASWTCTATGAAACGDTGDTGDIATTVDLPIGDTATFTVTGTRRPVGDGHAHEHRHRHGGVGHRRPGRQQQLGHRHRRPHPRGGPRHRQGRLHGPPPCPARRSPTPSRCRTRPVRPTSSARRVVDSFPAELSSTSWTCARCIGRFVWRRVGQRRHQHDGRSARGRHRDLHGHRHGRVDGDGRADQHGDRLGPDRGDRDRRQRQRRLRHRHPDAGGRPVDHQDRRADRRRPRRSDQLHDRRLERRARRRSSMPASPTWSSADLLGAGWTCVATGGSSCTGAGSGSIDELVTLAPAGSATFTLTATVASTATGSLVNTADVEMPTGTTDPTPGNNTATDTDTLTPQADLAVTKVNAGTTVVAGSATSYTVEVDQQRAVGRHRCDRHRRHAGRPRVGHLDLLGNRRFVLPHPGHRRHQRLGRPRRRWHRHVHDRCHGGRRCDRQRGQHRVGGRARHGRRPDARQRLGDRHRLDRGANTTSRSPRTTAPRPRCPAPRSSTRSWSRTRRDPPTP